MYFVGDSCIVQNELELKQMIFTIGIKCHEIDNVAIMDTDNDSDVLSER